MSENKVHLMLFNDGAAYEKMMGSWSRLVGEVFIDWLAPNQGLRWLDVGCGNGAFSDLISSSCSPVAVHGIDPSEEQINYAQTRQFEASVKFQLGDAMALPLKDNNFDIAVMALVIFFLPNPAKGVDEMVRAVLPGGTVASYTWDTVNNGSPSALVSQELSRMGFKPGSPPNAQVSEMSALKKLWMCAGVETIESCQFKVERKFKNIDEYWAITSLTPNIQHIVPLLTVAQIDELKKRLQEHLLISADGRVSQQATANAIKGTVM
jgi:ubiquinone/menaquinone biosynthesis C-methylase UbiE